MILKQTLEAVNKGILTDEQLDEAIEHYTRLEQDLKCHGSLYHLVWKDVSTTLYVLNLFKDSRLKK